MIMRNNTLCKIVGVGTVRLKIFDGVIRILTDVRHVSELKRNLISWSTLDSKRHKYTGKCGVLKVNREALVVMRDRKTLRSCIFYRIPQL